MKGGENVEYYVTTQKLELRKYVYIVEADSVAAARDKGKAGDGEVVENEWSADAGPQVVTDVVAVDA